MAHHVLRGSPRWEPERTEMYGDPLQHAGEVARPSSRRARSASENLSRPGPEALRDDVPSVTSTVHKGPRFAADVHAAVVDSHHEGDGTGQALLKSPRRSPGRQAIVANGGSTIGLSLFGVFVDYMVPGGPAHLSRCLDKDDKVEAVDGCPVNEGNVVGMLFGSDLPGSKVKLRVKKADSGKILEVELVRVPKTSLETIVKLFKKITLLKQNGHNNEAYENNTYPAFQERSLQLIDQVVSLISRIQVERHNHDVENKQQFELLYTQVSSQLAQAFDTIEELKAEIQLLKLEKSQAKPGFAIQMDMERDTSALNAYHDHDETQQANERAYSQVGKAQIPLLKPEKSQVKPNFARQMDMERDASALDAYHDHDETRQDSQVKRLAKELEDLRNSSAEVILRQRNVTQEILVGASVKTLACIP